jgi:hypothetical protein
VLAADRGGGVAAGGLHRRTSRQTWPDAGRRDNQQLGHQGRGATGSLANPRRLECHNRNVWVPGEDKRPYRPDTARPRCRAAADPRPAQLGARAARQPRANHQFKVGVLVRKGQTATLEVPAAFHRVAGLLYAEQARSAQTPAEADHAVTFTACADHHTPFVGGFFVLEPRCVPLEIRPSGGRPVREVISFFAGDC